MQSRLLLALILAAAVAGVGGQTPTAPTQSPAAQSSAPDTLAAKPVPPDSISPPKSRADTVLVVKHRFNHREQIITGSVVMTCLALMMVVMNNYNPR